MYRDIFNGLSSVSGLMGPHKLGKTTYGEVSQFFSFAIFDPEYRVSQMEQYLYFQIFPCCSHLKGGRIFFLTPPQNLDQYLAYSKCSVTVKLNEWHLKENSFSSVSKTTVHNKFVKIIFLFIIFESVYQNWYLSPSHLLWNLLVSHGKE